MTTTNKIHNSIAISPALPYTSSRPRPTMRQGLAPSPQQRRDCPPRIGAPCQCRQAMNLVKKRRQVDRIAQRRLHRSDADIPDHCLIEHPPCHDVPGMVGLEALFVGRFGPFRRDRRLPVKNRTKPILGSKQPHHPLIGEVDVEHLTGELPQIDPRQIGLGLGKGPRKRRAGQPSQTPQLRGMAEAKRRGRDRAGAR